MNSRYFKFKDIKIENRGPYLLTNVSNIETGNASSRKLNYIDTDGAEYRDIFYAERIFEISGHILADNDNEMVLLKRKLIKACSLKDEFVLEYFNRQRKHIAKTRFDKLPTFEDRIGWCLPFKLYLTIPSFYWESYKLYRVNLFKLYDNITDSFTLPCVFTTRIEGAQIYNHGDCETYPVFEVINSEMQAGSGILIENTTTDKWIEINYSLSPNEIVTINTANQTVSSNLNGNITPKITLDTEFFPFDCGVNNIECTCPGNTVRALYRERFLGV